MKKVVSLLLVLVLALGMSSIAFAKVSNGQINGVVAAPTVIKEGEISNNTGTTWTPGTTVRPGDKLSVQLPALTVFSIEGGTRGTTSMAYYAPAKNEMSKVTVRTKVSKGSKLYDVEVKYAGNPSMAYVRVKFIDPFVSNNTDGADFDFDVYFDVDGTRYDDKAINVNGTLKNVTGSDIDADVDYVSLDGGRISECTEYSRTVEFYLGNGVSYHGKAFNGKKYYGYVKAEPTDDQIAVMDKYRIDEVYNVKQVGLNTVTDYVKFDVDGAMYVYDGNLKYLGQAKEKIAVVDDGVYYLSTKKLDVDADVEPEEEEEDDDVVVPVAPPKTGGDSDYVANANDNPSTGK